MADEMIRKAAHIIVYGSVQGVNFRYFTQMTAVRLELVGWVRNLPDETVEIWAEGAPEALERFILFVNEGPPAAQVDRLAVEWLTPQENYASFRIRY